MQLAPSATFFYRDLTMKDGTMQDDDLATVMRALGHPVRLTILRTLARQQQRCCCTDVMAALPLAQSTVSQHIKVLLDAGLIERRPEGTRNCYSLRADRIEALGSACAGLFSGLSAELISGASRKITEPA